MDCTELRAMQWKVRPPGKGPLGIFRVLHGPDETSHEGFIPTSAKNDGYWREWSK